MSAKYGSIFLYLLFIGYRKCDVISRGFSGYNTKWCKVILPDILKEFDPKNIALATIFLGANDSNLPENVTQHVPLPDYKQDLKDMVDMMTVRLHFVLCFNLLPPSRRSCLYSYCCVLCEQDGTQFRAWILFIILTNETGKIIKVL